MNTAAEPTEHLWIEQLRQGDERALRRIFDRHYPLLLTDIYRILPDKDAGKDLAQEVFVDLWRKHTELDIHTSLRAYLRRAAINKTLNYIKTQKRFVFEDSETWADEADASEHEIDRKTEQESLEASLHRAIDNLPEKCRIVFSLSRFEKLSHREIAEQLNISVKTIENQITKALKTLREALTNHADLSCLVILMANWCWNT